MEFIDLSLAGGKSSTDDEEMSPMKMMKWTYNNAEAPSTPSFDLQLKHPLPSDWEQCLDLQSGRMYYVNRKTSRKSWKRPEDDEEQMNPKVDLELNISTGSSSSKSRSRSRSRSSGQITNEYSHSSSTNNSTSNNMVALACSNCHLLVILSRSSPSCPNCKYVHSLAPKLSLHSPLI